MSVVTGANATAKPQCRSCGAVLTAEFVDLGLSPVSNAFPRLGAGRRGEVIYPLRALACSVCRLVQLEDHGSREDHFHDDYAYFSSVSSTWLKHAADYSAMIVDRLGLSPRSKVVEIASNDGYLLRNFVERGVPCLGVDPAANCAAEAKARFGVDTRVGFFGADMGRLLAAEGWTADLIVANNVLAHVPDLNDFLAGFRLALKREGTITFEFPHLLELARMGQFDTIYHEHYSYLSLLAAEAALARQGLRAYDVEHLPSHGGSLRLFACHAGARHPDTAALSALRAEEREAGLERDEFYSGFGEVARRAKRNLLRLLIDLKSGGARICAYGAAAKGTTLLNYCGIGRDMVDFVVDRNPHKQGRAVPGTGIEIHAPAMIDQARPDYVLILPWNIADEITASMAHIRDWGGRFIVPIPQARILD